MVVFLKKFVGVFRKIEEGLLVSLFSIMVLVATSQIFLSFFSRGVIWFDSLLKYLVLWIAMLASSIATYSNKHIKIDLIGRFAKGRLKSIVNLTTNLFSAVVCTVITIVSIIYIAEIEYGSTDPSPFLGIDKWILLIILPVGFGLMSVKFTVFSILSVYFTVTNRDVERMYSTEKETIHKEY
ncbi:MAG TPA: TRAP transporter small permease subunit [Spirochaetota bacterium]|jgi:TRAP-type C4-dicarboxylate transport system permease small subunit|nr:MAG: Tripartite ATP-independent periplasmic transporter [Spirochaetes bacterium ADurb.Bin133]HNZ26716.1 TRAP transporter small permease subunit [Spirochaetota bacterium]HPY88032.1 TRAP transporter small permease subunit [Spirochaetota bacterium]